MTISKQRLEAENGSLRQEIESLKSQLQNNVTNASEAVEETEENPQASEVLDVGNEMAQLRALVIQLMNNQQKMMENPQKGNNMPLGEVFKGLDEDTKTSTNLFQSLSPNLKW
eukprot:TRINITY_DN3203_c1_g3_i2.p1 TRINITY_DN3203_c1_g3~~TRINITY_DN3203_c1_g3_i2.p1  ORF type:complete len:113 (-),score=24.14 TRINITY_DN3203_c1_g3_i2:778-1116(-)